MNSDTIQIEDITKAFLSSPEQGSLIEADENRVIRPKYSNEIKSLFALLNFPLFGTEKENFSLNISMYAAVIEHGKTFLTELFFIDESKEKYLGSYAIYRLTFPKGNNYTSEYDDWLMDKLSSMAFGIKQDYKKVAKNITFVEDLL